VASLGNVGGSLGDGEFENGIQEPSTSGIWGGLGQRLPLQSERGMLGRGREREQAECRLRNQRRCESTRELRSYQSYAGDSIADGIGHHALPAGAAFEIKSDRSHQQSAFIARRSRRLVPQPISQNFYSIVSLLSYIECLSLDADFLGAKLAGGGCSPSLF